MQTMANKVLINRKKLLGMIPLSDRTIYNLELRGEFPRAGSHFHSGCFLFKNGVLYFITRQKKPFCTEFFNVMRLMDEKQAKYALALGNFLGVLFLPVEMSLGICMK